MTPADSHQRRRWNAAGWRTHSPVAFLVAVGAAETGRPTLMFLTKEAVRPATDGFAHAVACAGCPPLADLAKRYEAAGGTIPMWKWIGDEAATTFSY